MAAKTSIKKAHTDTEEQEQSVGRMYLYEDGSILKVKRNFEKCTGCRYFESEKMTVVVNTEPFKTAKKNFYFCICRGERCARTQ